METLSPVTLGTTTGLVFLGLLAFRPLLYKLLVNNVTESLQGRRAFLVEFSICILAGLFIYGYNRYSYGFPLFSIFSLLTGCIILGFFIGLDGSLHQERRAILKAMEKNSIAPLPKRFFSMTRKFTFVAVLSTLFSSLVISLVFARDIIWLTKVTPDEAAIHEAQLSVAYEIFFIMAVLMALMINLIISYSRNLRLLFNNETKILEQVSNGNLNQKVPVATRDEFGIIADHTNTMIDGLRHRFELLSEMKLAEEVQQNLLPAGSPDINGLDISGISLYCDETGGDYFDYFQLPGDRLGIVVADACGHGVGAAILMTSVRAFLQMAVRTYSSPGKLLTEINRFITRDCERTGRFTSMFFLETDRKKSKMRWVRAGHEPALYYSAARKTLTHLDGPGLVLGVDEDFLFTDSSRPDIESNDIILIGTDGIKETRNSSNEMFGEQRIGEIISTHDTLSAKQIQDAIIEAVNTFRHPLSQEDDITLVVVKITPVHH
ncbi:PP2C family protein-serine/threonine phosphatase [Desulfomarina sp.]